MELTGKPSVDKPWLKYYDKNAIKDDLPENTIYGYLVENNKDYPNRVALNYFDRKIKYKELIDNIDKTAKALLNFGVKKGDVVTISTPTLPETIYLFYAISKIGAIANMVDPRTSVEGIEDYVNEAESKLLFIVDVAAEKAKNIKEKTSVEKVIAISPADSLPFGLNYGYRAKEFIESIKEKRDNFFKKNECYTWNEFFKEGNIYVDNEEYIEYKKDIPVAIVHTGGTTGRPKGVLLSNDNLNAAAYQCKVAGFDFKREHNWLNIMPPFIAYGIGNGLHLPLICGMEVILIPQFDPKTFEDLLIKYNPNHMTGVPSHYGYIINSKKLDNKDLSYIIAPTVGGDKMDEELEKQTNEFLKNHNCKYKVTKGYGMTEVNAAVAACTSNENNEIGSVGIPFSKTIISIFDPETREELGYNQVGEVCITGPNTMLGYFKNQEETDKIIIEHNDGKKWVHSGDLGYMTEDGKLYIKDRIKRMIIRHDGFKVFPSEIEKIISTHPSVKDCSVVGVPDLEHAQGKVPKAYVVLKSKFYDENKVKDEIFYLCSQKLAEYSQPDDLEYKTSLPLTSIGKVDYHSLEKEHEEKLKEKNIAKQKILK